VYVTTEDWISAAAALENRVAMSKMGTPTNHSPTGDNHPRSVERGIVLVHPCPVTAPAELRDRKATNIY